MYSLLIHVYVTHACVNTLLLVITYYYTHRVTGDITGEHACYNQGDDYNLPDITNIHSYAIYPTYTIGPIVYVVYIHTTITL